MDWTFRATWSKIHCWIVDRHQRIWLRKLRNIRSAMVCSESKLYSNVLLGLKLYRKFPWKLLFGRRGKRLKWKLKYLCSYSTYLTPFDKNRQTRGASWFSPILRRFLGRLSYTSALIAGWWYGRTTRLKSRDDSADFPAPCIGSWWNLTQRPFVCPVQRRRLEVSSR